MNKRRFFDVVTTSFVLTLVMVSVADARIVRRGGGGSPVAPAITGTDTYLLPTGMYSTPGTVVPEDALLGLPSYSYSTGTGDPIQAHHNWGAACGENRQVPGTPDGNFYDCFFLLGSDEIFEWSGHIIGLPELGVGPTNAPMAELSYRWTLQAGAQVYEFDQDNPNSPLGPSISRPLEDPDGFEETCYARFSGYDAGGCQLVEINSGLTGSQLLEAAMGGDISLVLSVELVPPSDSLEFVNLSSYADTTPSFLRGEVAFSPTRRLFAQSLALPIQIELTEVPAPAPLILLLSGLTLIRIGRITRRRKPVCNRWLSR